MMNDFRAKHGFTMAETLVALAITVSAMAVAIGGWVFVERGEKINSVQAELDIDVRRTIERLKADLRLSAQDKIVFYPEGPGPYTAISFPIARDDDHDGLIELDAEGKIIWDKTLIYHVWSSTPNRLLLTTFDPRDNSLTDAQRQEQLNQVVAAGHGGSTYNGAHAKTRILFQNLFTWKITSKGIVFDAYDPVLGRELNVSLGSVLIGPGDHTFQFIAVDKNPASSQRKIGLDTLTVSPSALEREAEQQLPATAQSGASAAADYLPGGSWSGNGQLLFPAAANGHSFTLTMENDRWEEVNFRDTGSCAERTVVRFDETLSPPKFVVQLEGPGYAWMAQDQTASTEASDNSNSLTGAVVRVLVRGEQMLHGGFVRLSGKAHYVRFKASEEKDKDLKISAAYIAEAASRTNFTPNAIGPGVQLFFPPSHLALDSTEPLSFFDSFYSQPNTTIPGGRSRWARTSTPFSIDAEKSYLISFLVSSDSGTGNASYWVEPRAEAPGAYVIPADKAPGAADAQAADWGGKNWVMTNKLYGVYGVYTLCPTNGLFTSQVVDTHQTAPAYSEVLFDASAAGGSVGVKVRTGNQLNLTDAPAWSNVAARASSGSINPGNNRYVQFQAILNPDNTGWNSPNLKKVAVRWPGESRIVDLAAMATTGPDYGIWEVKVDGKSPVKGVTVDLTIYKDVPAFGGKSTRLTSSMVTEIEPRNTGR